MTQYGPIVSKSYCARVMSYLDSLSHTYTPRIGQPRRVSLIQSFRDSRGEWLILPRSALRELEGFVVRDLRAPSRAPSLARDTPFLYDDQDTIVTHICAYLRATIVKSLCLDLRAGYGKTFIAAGVIARLGARSLYITPTRELARQVAHDLCATVDHTTIIATSSSMLRNLLSDSCCVVAVINTVARARIQLGEYFSLIIFDEAHMYCTEARMKVFRACHARWLLGLSATIGERRDGFDFAVKHHFGSILRADDVPGFNGYHGSQFNIHVRAIKYNNPNARNLRHESTDTVFAHYMYEQFAQDDARNMIILEEARTLVNSGHNLFIFAEERAHVEYLAQKIVELDIASDCAIFYGGISREMRANALDNARVICATYGYSGTGISIVRMTAAIFATPRYSNMKQIIGRILRRGSDTDIPRIIVDIIDTNTCLARQFYWRKNAYEFYGASYDIINHHQRQ